MLLKGKTVVLALSGSIAAYKIVNLARMLKKLGAGRTGADDQKRDGIYYAADF